MPSPARKKTNLSDTYICTTRVIANRWKCRTCSSAHVRTHTQYYLHTCVVFIDNNKEVINTQISLDHNEWTMNIKSSIDININSTRKKKHCKECSKLEQIRTGNKKKNFGTDRVYGASSSLNKYTTVHIKDYRFNSSIFKILLLHFTRSLTQ